MKRILAFMFAFMYAFILSSSAFAVNAVYESEIYHSDKILGKIFPNGKNTEVTSKDQMDTSIENVVIDMNYGLSFSHADEKYSMSLTPLLSKANNAMHDHFIFAASNLSCSKFTIINISMTYNATVDDLMPANCDLLTKTVLSIIVTENSSGDVYYWQGELLASNSLLRNAFSTVQTTMLTDATSMSPETESSLRQVANEFYYSNVPCQSFTLTEDDFNEMLKVATESQSDSPTPQSAGTHNPLYNLYNVPDSVFTSVTDKWSNGVLISNERSYYAYSSTKYGSSNIYTRIMIVSFTSSNTSNGYVYGDDMYQAERKLQVEVEANETVVYYPSQELFDLLLGGNDSVSLNPSIELKKRGNDKSHVVVSRNYNGEGLYGSSTASGVASILIDVIDDYLVSGAIGYTKDILEISGIEPGSYFFGGYKMYKETAELQTTFYGIAMGGMEVKMEGFIRSPGHYYNVICEFNASTQSTAQNTTWVLHYSLS